MFDSLTRPLALDYALGKSNLFDEGLKDISNKGSRKHTCKVGRSVAVFQSLSSLIFVTRGNLIDIPLAVCVLDLLNSAPVISQTGAF